ncbi:MAG: ethanolamine utilization microcompartment protein EutL [Deltaproteobacteria bacterium]|jgi:ethanolamine utilization protein EutL|nr:ethanolamine utilization microcompartment protein EutL [Deltaproteobacteria bacterium]
MAKNDPLKTSILAAKIIPNVSIDLAKDLGLKPGVKSLGLVTTDCDDVTYTALDEATKMADVEVIYAKSFYGGAANANTKLAGEILGVLGGPNPAEIRSGLNALKAFIENDAWFVSANDDNTIIYYAHTISRTGSYLSKIAGVREGESLAYLIAPPLEAVYAIDMALKAADVRMAAFYGPPSETNFGGGLLTGSQSACKAACEAFGTAVQYVADNPIAY